MRVIGRRQLLKAFLARGIAPLQEGLVKLSAGMSCQEGNK
jgi:hypothetical protein